MHPHVVAQILCIFFVSTSHAQNAPKIALVDYRPLLDPSLTPTQRLEGNSQNYIKILDSITKNATSEFYLVVFPDGGLHQGLDIEHLDEFAVPTIRVGDLPCENSSFPKFFRDLSCAAQHYKTLLLINVIEKQSDCIPQLDNNNYRNCYYFDSKIYTTTILLSPSGKIEEGYHRYYKNYLYAEEYFDNNDYFPISFGVFPTTPKDPISYDDFYGVVVSGDIFAQYPVRTMFLADFSQFSHFVYPTNYEWEFPFLTPIQVGQMWAQGYGVELLTSGVNLDGSGGTGIYTKNGIIQPETVVVEGSSALIYDYPPKSPEDVRTTPVLTTEEIDDLAKKKDDLTFSFDETIFQKSTSAVVKSNARICSEDFCCELTPTISGNITENSYTYWLVAFQGLKNFTKNVQEIVYICAVVACLDSTIESCGKRFPKYEDIEWPLTFQEITIKATAKRIDGDRVFFPNSLLSSVTPIDPKLTSWKVGVENDLDSAIFSIKEAQTRLLVFGIIGIEPDAGLYVNSYNDNFLTTPKPNGATRVGFESLIFSIVSLIILL